MIIYKGEKHIIRAKGTIAEKEGPDGVREMKYYPERDVEAIAGEIDELTAWQLMHDIAAGTEETDTPISPSHILIDGDRFKTAEWSEGYEEAYMSPQGYSPSWALGATIFFVFMGCPLYQGEGGKIQTATTPVPTLRKGLEELSRTVGRCLAYNPEERPSMKELKAVALRNIERLKKEKPKGRNMKRIFGEEKTSLEESWPEEMK